MPLAQHNFSLRAGEKATVVLEASSGKRSRKSTRKSRNRGKPAEELRGEVAREMHSPEARAERARISGKP